MSRFTWTCSLQQKADKIDASTQQWTRKLRTQEKSKVKHTSSFDNINAYRHSFYRFCPFQLKMYTKQDMRRLQSNLCIFRKSFEWIKVKNFLKFLDTNKYLFFDIQDVRRNLVTTLSRAVFMLFIFHVTYFVWKLNSPYLTSLRGPCFLAEHTYITHIQTLFFCVFRNSWKC